MTVTDILLLVFAATCSIPALQQRIGWAIGGYRKNVAKGYADAKRDRTVRVEPVEEGK